MSGRCAERMNMNMLSRFVLPLIRRTAVLLLLSSLISTVAARGWSTSVLAQAQDPCALLMTSEIEDISGGEKPRLWQRPFATEPSRTTVANGDSSVNAAIGFASCQFVWGSGTFRFKLDVTVSDASRMGPGASPEALRQHLQAMVKAGTAAEGITEAGDAAVFTSDSYYLATTTAIVKGRLLRIQLDGLDARDKKDGMIRLLKAAAARL